MTPFGKRETRVKGVGLFRSAAGRCTSGLCAVLVLGAVACASSSQGPERVRLVRGNDAPTAEVGGISPDKQAEIQLLLQEREHATTKCYDDVLNDKHDRAFKGSIAVILTLEPTGQASDVKVESNSLNQEVADCLIEKLKSFEYPQIEHRGSMQYVYHFEPAY